MALSLTSSKTTTKSFGRSCLMPLTQRNGAVVELFFCLLMANGQTRGFFSFEAYQEQSTHMPQRGYPLGTACTLLNFDQLSNVNSSPVKAYAIDRLVGRNRQTFGGRVLPQCCK